MCIKYSTYKNTCPDEWSDMMRMSIDNVKNILQEIANVANWRMVILHEDRRECTTYHLKAADPQIYDLEFSMNGVYGVAGLSYGCFAMTMENSYSLMGKKNPPLRPSIASRCLTKLEVANYIYHAMCPTELAEDSEASEASVVTSVVSEYTNYVNHPENLNTDLKLVKWSIEQMLSCDAFYVRIV